MNKKVANAKTRTERYYKRIEQTWKIVENIDPATNAHKIVAACKKLESNYNLHQEAASDWLNASVDAAGDEAQITEATNNYATTCDATEEIFSSVLVKLSDAENVIQAQAAQTGSQQQNPGVIPTRSSALKLPKIELRKFDGTLSSWSVFYETFKSLVHEDKTLTPLEKFHFLSLSLDGSATRFLQNLPVSENSYKILWDNLVAKYQNKRTLGVQLLDDILEIPMITNTSSGSFNKLVSVLQDSSKLLKSLKIDNLDDFILLHISLKKLPVYVRKQFETKFVDTETPTYDNLIEFLMQQAKVTELSGATKKDETPRKHQTIKGAYINSRMAVTCFLCKENHPIRLCGKYLKMTIQERHAKAMELNLCFKCLGKSHSAKDCYSKILCHCKKPHHFTLHGADLSSPQNKTEITPEASTKMCYASRLMKDDEPVVLLGTALINIQDADGNYQQIRAVIDSAAMTSFITDKCARKLKLNRNESTTFFAGVGDTPSKAESSVICIIKPRFKPDPLLHTEAVVVPVITNSLPTSQLSQELRNMWAELNLADPTFDTPGEVDMLIGADLFPYIYTGRKRFARHPIGCALESIFGWVLTGKVCDVEESMVPQRKKKAYKVSLLSLDNSSLEKSIAKFWQLEEVPEKVHTNPEDELCEKTFQEQHYRDSSGRYVVPIMLKVDSPIFNGSFPLAKQRLLNMERKLQKDSLLKTGYSDFMKEYLELGHMSEVTPVGNANYYIPHHCVIREASISTKLRVVFDASMTSYNGISLNSTLYPGPKLQKDITDIIARFRTKKIAFTTDICKMFRQVLILPEHRRYQHILWREDGSEDIKDFELNTISYGTTSAPFLANRTIKQLVLDEGSEFPKAAEVVNNDIFVDDIVSSIDSIEEAIELRNQLIGMMKKGKFELKKWASSHPEFLEGLNEHDVVHKIDLSKDELVKHAVLGIQWLPKEDCFTYNQIDFDKTMTKRALLSNIAKMYDPVGYITPVILTGKLIIQQLWLRGLDWDDIVPPDLQNKWSIMLEQLSLVSELRIPRYIFDSGNPKISLIGFSDASQRGYGACIYVRTNSVEPKVHLFTAKSKVAPLKPLTVPRLELCGAGLLVKLISFVQQVLLRASIKIEHLITITDSTTVLNWLATPAYELHTYVANRVVNILEKLPNNAWAHISTNQNPADLASRGLYPTQILNNNLWWNGPIWLSQEPDKWLITPIHKVQQRNVEEYNSEIKTKIVATILLTPSPLLEKFSSLSKLRRVTAWIWRFYYNSRGQKIKGPLSAQEHQRALNFWILHVQKVAFDLDVRQMKKGLAPSPKLLSLNPYIDSLGLLRVGGRLQHANLPYKAKHPIILPNNSTLTTLIIAHYHEMYFHSGPRLLQAILLQKFWIISCRNTLRAQLRKCVKCNRLSPRSLQPMMGSLPSSRVTPSKCFLKVGIDFGGPFLLKESKRRNASSHKAYLCLFICMTTKAVHLELVSALSTEAFLAALERFVSRRGLCQEIFTDCGTNFVGAKNYLNELRSYVQDNSAQIQEKLADKEITWNLNPPAAPHFGGLWEAGIKSVKHLLTKTIGNQNLNFEEMTTLFTKIEAVLNSRPLCPLSSDTEDLEPLTPAHFLIGAPLLSLPEYDISNEPVNRLSRWQLVKQLSQHFWQRWSKEYLNTLNQLNKWYSKSTNVKVGDLCLIREENLPPLQWRLGRITQIHPGADQVVRVVTIKTASGTLTRPVVKICILPIDSEN